MLRSNAYSALLLLGALLVACDDAAPPSETDAAHVVDAMLADATPPDRGPATDLGTVLDLGAPDVPDLAVDMAAGCQADTDCEDNRWCDPDGVCRVGCRHEPDNCPPGRTCSADRVCRTACEPDARCPSGLAGPCADGRTVCDGGEATCEPLQAPVDERCNGIDDNCDGQTDEPFALGEACDDGIGLCAGRGVTVCAADGLGTQCARDGLMPSDERCDGLDNDCDGQTDETFDLGGDCTSGAGACARAGQITCTADGAGTRCDAVPGEPEIERCDGLDNDCDEQADEAFEGQPLGQACFGGDPAARGVGACRDGFQTCVEGAWGVCEGAVLPSAERCDAVDNDCNGATDDDQGRGLSEACYDGGPGTVDVGPCRAGFRSCVGGVWSACQNQRTPVEEICDLEDNDCNGQSDDLAAACACLVGAEQPCYAGAEGTAGVGPCRAGTQTCVAPGVWGACDGQVLPSAEVCNREDDDCDGQRDNEVDGVGAACQIGQGQCASEGVTRCAILGGFRCAAPFIAPAPERCDTLDNDCDGQTDEAFPVGEACAVGAGACERPGVLRCTAQEQFLCEAEAGAPVVEICNRADDDCDGEVDEDFGTGRPCTAGVGACRVVGEVVCDGAAGVCDAVPGAPSVEICDGLDNDCDGQFDEGFNRGAACVSGVGICAARGVLRCDAAGEAVCSAVPEAPAIERCNGFDDDCDGQTDEALLADRPCNTDVPGICRGGRQTCIGGDFVCVSVNEPTEETCDTQDEDCDGQVDELGTIPCGEGVCRRNLVACVDGERPECDPFLGQQLRELCNGLDDDCDGATDEDAVGVGGVCGQGRGGCARLGAFSCEAGFLLCDVAPGAPQPEACNGVDDDCDGTTDEDSVAPGGACVVGLGECARPGVPGCIEGALGCVGDPGPAVDEICDGLDNNCDGTIDEGFGAQICGEGVCRRVLANCDGGAVPACDPLQGAGPEICNGLDDDCDGSTDEGVPGTGVACVGGLGLCHGPGLTACREGRLGCAVPDAAAPEVCNGLDDDCDGVTDEDAAQVGEACTAGLGSCARVGALTCSAGRLACDAQAGEAAPEICNLQDDDCDGTVDDGLGTTACGVGRCLRDLPACTDGEPPFCAPLQGAIDEQCNGIDDDCDGTVDEDSPQVGDACLVGVGACSSLGARSCVDGALICDAPDQAAPVAEVCNGLDDDCDLQIDEDFNAGRRCETGVGECRALGRVVCTDAGGARCDAQAPPPNAEICNGLDDDCDGSTDEGLDDLGPCPTGAQGVCGVGQGTCRQGQVACDDVAAPADEICDGLDNNCNGQVDEGLGTVPCGVGVCARALPACVDGAPVVCEPLVGVAAEICNGLDDDCDGIIDENPADEGAPCNAGQGACAVAGVQRCVDGAPTCAADLPEPQDERCNQIDDDCDGLVDEETIESFAACSVGVGVCQRDAFFTCEAGVARCPAVAGNPTGNELCNGLDDDCDGQLDEGFGNQLCGVGRCQHALPNCDGAGAPACEPLTGARPESCNGVDDDCDGVTDEDVPGADRACGAGQGACRRDGITACVAGVLACDATPGNPGVETCNAVDDDCDGTTDEAPIDAGGACAVGLGVCTEAGINHCILGRLRCDAVANPPAEEICDGLDNDCDGAIDEALGELRCGLGICERVVPTCTNGRLNACDPFAGARAEQCNGADDDCDGAFDEGLGVIECGIGVCAKAVPACLGGLPRECDPDLGAGPELCDGRDNDCDGVVDESPRGDGTQCSDGIGACERVALQHCIDGALICDATAGDPEPERCNDADDDCDGQIDEDVNDDGQICSVGIGGCTRQGLTHCIDGFLACDAVAGAPQAEICNEIDDDCDNIADEDGPDCNRNGYGDACDIVSARSGDCNANGVPDDCDIASGTADCNRDGIPDVCRPNEGCDFDITPPTVAVSTVVAAVVAGNTLEVRLTAADNLALDRVGMTRDGVEIPVDQHGIAQVPFPVAGLSIVEAYAFDRAGNRAAEQLVVRVLRPTTDPVPRPSRDAAAYRMCDLNSVCPVARVAVPVIRTALGGVVQLDASPSDALRFRWTVVRAPIPVAISEGFPGDPALGGPGDDPLTPTAELPVPVPGLYEVVLSVEAADGTPAPTAACPSAGSVVVEVLPEAPLRADGAVCDTAWALDACEEGLHCRPEILDDGQGRCGVRQRWLGEREPDNSPDDLTVISVGADTQIVARLDPCVGDGRDLYALLLDRAGLFTIETTDLDGLCAGDTRLTRLDPALFEREGLAPALANPIARDDDSGVGLCSQLLVDLGNPGLYVFVVDSPRAHFAFDYALRVIERVADGQACDPRGIDTRCREPATCVDADDNGEGTCLRP
jgi:hypothetical protein